MFQVQHCFVPALNLKLANLRLETLGSECMVEWVTHSPAETKALGRRLAPAVRPGDVLALCGDLGSGKTTFVQGLAKGLKVREAVTSPSFVLVREYPGRLPVYHLDLFRLNRLDDLETIGYDEYLAGQGVTHIEWGHKMRQALPRGYVELAFTVAGDTPRTIAAIPHGPRATGLVREWT